MTIPLGFAQVTHAWGGLPFPSVCTYGISLDFSAPLATTAEQLHDAFGDAFVPRVTGDVTLLETTVKAGPDQTGPSVTFSLSRVGTHVGDLDAPQVCVIVEKSTAIGGRRGKGRFFVPGGPSTDFQDNGAIIPASLALWNTAANNFNIAVPLVAGVISMVLLHNPSAPGTENPTPEPVPTEVIGLLVDPITGTQRRRLRR